MILALRGQKQLSLLSPGFPRQMCGNQRTLGGIVLVIHHMVHVLKQGPIFLHEGKATYPSPPKGLFFLRQKMVMFTRLLSDSWTQRSFCLSVARTVMSLLLVPQRLGNAESSHMGILCNMLYLWALDTSAASFVHRYTNLQARVIINQALQTRQVICQVKPIPVLS